MLLLLCLLVPGAATAAPQTAAARSLSTNAPDPARWAQAIEAFEKADRVSPPAEGGIVFVGSSSIRRWSRLEQDFRGLPVTNRGFGGSQLPEVIAFADRIILPYAPRQVVVYCGANDIANGRRPEQVVADFQQLVSIVQAKLPQTRVAFISVAPNPARWEQVAEVRAANQAVAAWAAGQPHVEYIDVFTHMLGPDGLPKPDIFVEDRLHLNEKGYALWRSIIQPFLRP